jgi:MFS family permease
MFSATPPAPRSGFLAVLLNRPFMMLFCGQVVSQIADKVFFVLLISLPYNYQSSPAWTSSLPSALTITFTLSAILLGSAVGIVVDRFPKKHMMIAADAICGVLILLIPLLPKQLFILWAITFLTSSMKQFLYPAEQAAIPLLVQRENLMSANALFMAAMMVSLIVGFVIGQPLLSWVTNWAGESSQGFFVAGLYLLAALIRLFVHIQETRNNMSLLSIHPWRDFQEGLGYLWNNRKVRNAIVQKTILYPAFTCVTVRAFDLGQRVGLKPTQFGFLLAAAGVGFVFGAAILGQWANRFHHKPLSASGFLSIAFVLATISFTRNLWLGLSLFVVLGLGTSLIDLPVQTVIQGFTQESMRGRVFGFQNSVVYITSSVALVVAGVLTDAVGLGAVLFGMSILIGIAGVWAWQNKSSVSQNI